MDELSELRQQILSMLSDGKCHTRKELMQIIRPSGLKALKNHIYAIKALLRQRGEDIVCVYRNHTFNYQHVRLLNDSHGE